MSQISPWFERFEPLLPDGLILDLACGAGRHSRHLHGMGRQVLAVDRDVQALSALQADGIATFCHDLESTDAGFSWPFEAAKFAGIVVTNYLHRPLFPWMLDSLTDHGILIYETFALGNEKFGKPANPAFLLQPGELIWQLQSNPRVSMHLIAFEQGLTRYPKEAVIQRVCACRLDSGSPEPTAIFSI
jgi:SAM-dependent methyltransferase